jgi:uncharacterized Zn-binding protein involved in type VI secretion
MAALTYKGAMSKGQDGGSPTGLNTKNQCTKSYVAEGLIGVVGDQFDAHTVGRTTHQLGDRQIKSGASKTYFEGFLAARVGDPINDGDAVADGSAKTSVE